MYIQYYYIIYYYNVYIIYILKYVFFGCFLIICKCQIAVFYYILLLLFILFKYMGNMQATVASNQSHMPKVSSKL